MTQLALFNDPAPLTDPVEPDIIDALLHHHDGNARAVIADLLADADFLRDQLWIAQNLMSKGMGRGWKPKYERI